MKNILNTLLIAAVLPIADLAAVAAEQPNVLFIAIDDLRPELGCYGSAQVTTPHIDRLASQGVVFDRAYCQVPVCGASRASLMTGILPTPGRFITFDTRADRDVPGAVTLPEAFRKAGYTTISNGKVFHVKDDAHERSWSQPAWQPEGGHMVSYDPETLRHLSERGRGRIYEAPDVPDDAYSDGKVAIKTIEDLRHLQQAGKPFFLACGFIRPHLPFYAPKRYWDLYPRDKIEIANNRQRPLNAPRDLRGSGEHRSYHPGEFEEGTEDWHRMMRHGYLASTSYVDKLTGDILAELEKLGLAENTIVVIWGDHGFHLGEHEFWGKHNTMHLSLRVPLILRVPGKAMGNATAIVESSDLFPTLCELAGVAVPGTVQGRSFENLLDEPGHEFREAAYSRFGTGDAVVTERFSYTSYRGGKAEMLYDLEKDPAENENVAEKPEYQETVAAMRRMLQERQKEAAKRPGGEVLPATGQKSAAGNAPGYEGDVPMPTQSMVERVGNGKQRA